MSRAGRLVGASLAALLPGSCAEDAAPGVVCTATGSCEESYPVTDAFHTTMPVYTDLPPAGGQHDPCWAEYVTYDHAIAPGHWVHNLEHGAVVLVYACPTDCATEVAALAAFQSSHARVVVAPYPDMAPGFAFLAWGHRLVAPELDEDALSRFYDAHFDRAPESVSAGPPATCPPL